MNRPYHSSLMLALLALGIALSPGAAAQGCGDCNRDGVISILDALRKAQIAVVIIVQGPEDLIYCDVDSDADIDILDALVTAQISAGLSVTLDCAALSLDPFTDPFTREHAKHLYRRAAFGGTSVEVDTAVIVGLTSATSSLVNFTNDPMVEMDAEQIYGGTLPPRPQINNDLNKEWWLHMIVSNPNPFQERFAWFLHDHFAIGEGQFSSDARWFMYEYINLMRRMSVSTVDTISNGQAGIGYDWPELVVQMTKDRAMLDWLDGRRSTASRPNENYARELWELFTLGEGVGYTEFDIQEAAKAFTGFFWYRVGGSGSMTEYEMRYRPGNHNTGIKTIFGFPGFYGYDDVSPFYETNGGPDPSGMPELGTTDPLILTDPVDSDGGVVAVTFQQRPVEASRFICQKLADFFLYDNPPDSVVDELALDLRTPGIDQWNLRPIILKIMRSKAFYSQLSMKEKYKNPMDFLIGFLRSSGLQLSPTLTTNADRMRQRLIVLDQVVLNPPDVSGWPMGALWIGAQGMLERFNFLNYAIEYQDAITQILPLTPTPRASIDAAGLVDHIADVLDVVLSANARTQYIDYVNQEWVGGMPVPLVFDPLDDTHLIMKTRGLYWLIGQYYDGHQE